MKKWYSSFLTIAINSLKSQIATLENLTKIYNKKSPLDYFTGANIFFERFKVIQEEIHQGKFSPTSYRISESLKMIQEF